MAISTEQTAQTFTNIATNVPLNCTFPLYAEDEVLVIYGKDSLEAVYNTDFTVELSEPNYNQFTITPKASLLTKINNLITADPVNETNFVTVRRELDYKTSVTPEIVRQTAFISREFERMTMRFQQIAEQAKRFVGLAPKNVGGSENPIYIEIPEENKVMMGDANGNLINGPDVQAILTAGSDAEDARDDAIAARNAAQTAQGEAEDARDDSQAARDAAQTHANNAGTAQTAAENARDAALNYRDAAQTAASNADADRIAAEAAAVLAGSTFTATSASSNSIATGSKNFTIQANKNFVLGQFIIAVDAANAANWMWGQVSSYNNGTGALVLDSQVVGGSGTKTSWIIGLSGARGPQGLGDVTLAGVQTLTNKTMDFAANTFQKQPFSIGFALSDETTTLTTGTNKTGFSAHRAMVITSVTASVETVSSSGLPTIDVNKNGSSIFTTRPTIDVSEYNTTTAATPSVISGSSVSLAAGDRVSFDQDVAGTGAKGMKVFLNGYYP